MTTEAKKIPPAVTRGQAEDNDTIAPATPSAIPKCVKDALPGRTFMLADLAKSGIGEEVAGRLGFKPCAKGFEIHYTDPSTGKPMYGTDGKPFVRTRVEHPVDDAKYLSAKGAGIRCYILPEAHSAIHAEPSFPLVLTEGEKKAACATLTGLATVGLGGIWNWLESSCSRDAGHHKINADLLPYLLPGRDVIFVVDSDASDPRKKPNFDRCAMAFAKCLDERGCILWIVRLPALADVDGRVGLDDYIMATGMGGAQLMRCLNELAEEVHPFVVGATAADLMATTFDPIKWVVPDMLPEGLGWLVGKSKLGKSWMALGLAIATSEGGYAFGKIRVDQGDVLYLALEDSPRRLQSRLRAMQTHPDEPIPTRLTFWTAADIGADYGRNIAEIRAWIDHHEEARLVVIDTWGRLAPVHRAGGDQYSDDTKAVSQLHRLALDTGVCILLVHHSRKAESDDVFDTLLGSTALMGVADSTWILRRGRGDTDAELHITGRDIREQALAMRFADGIWSVEGDLAETKATEAQRDILAAMATHGGPMTCQQLADAMGYGKANAAKHLARLATKNLVTHTARGYVVQGN